AFAAERTPDSTKAKGFNQRIIQLTSLYGFPQYDISEVINPAGALIGLDRHVGGETSEEEIVNKFDNKKGNNKEIILIDKQQQVGGSFADANNASQASHASQTLVESGDASDEHNDHTSQASQSKSCNTIYRLGRSDIFACQYCRLRGDKWEIQQHLCKGSKK
ncbi:MAG: hypothetical protein M3Y53_10520, partial [Thermoproteota archaeon]|nr:hypothetical protein [Thermoproteota archaeon]